jgi:hypothetical protein
MFKSALGFFLINKIQIPDVISSKEVFDGLYMLRHDVIHYSASFKLAIPFGERHIEDIPDLSNLRKSKNWELIRRQSPDIILIEKDEIKIYEFSVSVSSGMSLIKRNKYQLLISELQNCGFSIEFIPIVIHPDLTQIDSELLVATFKFTDPEIFDIMSTLSSIQERISQIQNTEIGKIWVLMDYDEKENNLDMLIKLDREKIINYYDSLEAKPFESSEDLIDVMNDEINQDEINDFFEEIDPYIDNFKPTLLTNSSGDLLSFHKFHKEESIKAKSNGFRSYLPLPHFPTIRMTSLEKNRSTQDDNFKVGCLRSILRQSEDAFLRLIGDDYEKKTKKQEAREILIESRFPYYKNNENCYIYKKVPKDLRESIAIDGPGRRKFVKLGSSKHIMASNKNSNHWMDPETDVSEIEKIAYQYSTIDYNSLSQDPSDWTGPGLSYLRFCQEVYREININCLRKILNKRFILKPTRMENVFVLLHPGPLLRTSDQVSIIWFKIICLRPEKNESKEEDDFYESILLNSHWKTWHSDRGVLHSNWLSVDSHRLDHYLRCYDKVMMSYLTYIDKPGKKLRTSVSEDTSNTLGIMILIYLEDKRSTSKMIQDARYIVMNNFSFFRYGKDLLEKLRVPIRTPLQLYLMNRMVEWINMKDDKLLDIRRRVKVGKVKQDMESGIIDDRFSGLYFKLPRLFTSGPDINFDQLLQEMYFCMLFNKDQDDPTHSSFQILSKILEGEKSLEEIKNTTRLHVGSKGKEIHSIITMPHKNQFSRRAISIGSILQSQSVHNSKPGGIAHSLSVRNSFLNKTLDEFATFKSSSMLDNKKYDKSSLFEKEDSIDIIEDSNEERKKQNFNRRKKENRQNRRRRCVQGVFELIEKGHFDSYSVLNAGIFKPTFFQIFKKNQVGGVREIVILDIEKRIIVNVLESLSRCVCKFDSREMLTHGDVKNQKYHSIIRNLRILQPKGKLIHLNFDKSRWGPSFQSIQFLYLFTPFKKELSCLLDYIILILMNHTNKRFILPEKLIKAWVSDPEDKYKHWMDPNLQKLKLHFLENNDLTYLNESNMGQGILHYTSSLLHLALISFRDELVKRTFKKRGIKVPLWSDLLSSDDSYTCISIDEESFGSVKKTLDLFLRCQEISERLFNCWTSTTKSSISPVFYEFNSLFGAGLGYHPTTLKFALSSVDVFCTDSFYRLVKESYNASRQLIENGSSLEIYEIAHKFNKIYCEFIFHTQNGGLNDFKNFGLRPKFVPYQLGVYPLSHPALMLFFGPESHNYNIVSNWNDLSKTERRVFVNSHRFTAGINLESFAEMSSLENIYTSLMRIEAVTTPSNLIKTLRSNLYFTPEEVTKHIESDPLLLFRKPTTMSEVKLKITLKMFQNSSIEASRQVSSALFFGRMSASVSAHAFTIPGELQGKHSFKDCISHILSFNEDNSFQSHMLYPDIEKYKSMKLMSMQHVDYLPRLVIETKNVIKLDVDRSVTRLENPINKILTIMWSDTPETFIKNSIIRDFEILKQHNPFIKDTLSSTIDMLNGDTKSNKCKLLCLLLLRLTGSVFKPIKLINYGFSERSPDRSFSNLIQNNHYTGLVGNDMLSSTINDYTSGLYDDVFHHANKDYLFYITHNKFIPRDHYSYNTERVLSIFKNTFVSKFIKRSLFFLMIAKNEIDDLSLWSRSASYIVHEYLIAQKKNQDGKYDGPGMVKVQTGNTKLILSTFDNTIKCNTIDPSLTYSLLLEAIKLLKKDNNVNINTFTTSQKGTFYIHDEKIFSGPKGNLFIEIANITDVNITCRKLHYFAENNSFSIEDKFGKYNMTIYSWAIPCDLVIDDTEYNSFEVFGIPYNSLIKIRAFSPEMNWQMWTPIQLARLVSNLNVKRPKYSIVTARRLGQNPSTWCDMKEESFNDEKFNSENFDPPDSFNYTENYEQEMMLEMQLNDDKKIQELLKIESIQEVINCVDPMESWVMDASVEMIKPIEIRNDVNLSFIISVRLKKLKYHILSRSVCDPNRLNKQTLISIKRKYSQYDGVKYIMWSLFFIYDILHQTTDEVSPRLCTTYENAIIFKLLGADTDSEEDELEL